MKATKDDPISAACAGNIGTDPEHAHTLCLYEGCRCPCHITHRALAAALRECLDLIRSDYQGANGKDLSGGVIARAETALELLNVR